jgi:hypothetical protein
MGGVMENKVENNKPKYSYFITEKEALKKFCCIGSDKCIGTLCMGWRFKVEIEEEDIDGKGYCGRAGRP